MLQKFDFENLRFCLDNYKPNHLFIRLTGSSGGKTKVSLVLEDQLLDFKKDGSGLHIFVNSDKIFSFPLREYLSGFSLGYERIDKEGKMIMLGSGEDPYDPKFPEPHLSILRTVLDAHLMEISFPGRVNLKFDSFVNHGYFKLWMIDKP